MNATSPPTHSDPDVQCIDRPDAKLLTLYVLQALLTTVGAPIVMIPLYFRYHTLRYRFDDEGVHVSWGVLFRREVSLAYARIQDIHTSSGLFERWLGIGTVRVQTAGAGASGEVTLEGLANAAAVRDFLYGKMRGVHVDKPAGVDAAAVELLHEIRDDVRAVRQGLAP